MKRVVFVVNRDFVLYNFRFELVKKLIEEKYEVYICLPYGPKVDLMTTIGANYIPLRIDGRGKSVTKDIHLIRDLKMILEKTNPDIILLYTTKIDIYGGIISRIINKPYIINISGLGTATVGTGILGKLVIILYRIAVKRASCVFFQNKENIRFFHLNNIVCKKEMLIPGSGVNIERWSYLDYPSENNGIVFVFIARLIKEKGIEEYLEVARRIKQIHSNTFFHVVGPDDGNYSKDLELYERDGYIIYHGMVQDTTEFLRCAHCVINPSYYPEGISNVCLEAASSGRPIITTDNPGCKDAVDDNISGYIVKKKDTKDLIRAVERFLNLAWEEKKSMGIKGRIKMKKEFDRKVVTEKYYEEICSIIDNSEKNDLRFN